jgi:hypothetical protein
MKERVAKRRVGRRRAARRRVANKKPPLPVAPVFEVGE